MANLTPAAGYDNVPQLETNTSVLAGPGGPSNSQAQALLNRTEQLKNEVSGKATLTNTPPVAETVGATQGLGSSGEAARSDHRHEMPGLATTAAPGFIELATQGEVNAGTAGALAVTPETLAARLATEALAGLIELATQGETDAGADDARAITPAKLVAYLRNAAGSAASDTQRGTVELATAAEVQTGSDNLRAVTPAGHAADATTTNTANRLVRRDGSGNINVGTVNGALNGNAATATKLQTARNIALGGDASGNSNFDGSGNITITVAVADSSHNHDAATIAGAFNAGGLQSLATDGYQRLPGGLVIQWGVFTQVPGSTTFTLPLAVTTNYVASVTAANTSLADGDNMGYSALTATQITLVNGHSANRDLAVIVIGRI